MLESGRTMNEQCSNPTKSGTPCKGRVWRDGLCRFHHPDNTEAQTESRRKGGRNKSNAARAERRMSVFTINTVRVLLSTALREVMDGEMDIGTAAAVATLGRAVILANEKTDLEKRMAEIERRAGIVTEEGAG